MKAIQLSQFGGPEVLQFVDLPDPIAGEGEVLVRARAIGVAKPDYLMRSGKYRWAPPLPAIPGNEMSGIIKAVGSGVNDLEIGQPVLVWGYEQGCYTQLGAYPVHRIQPLPQGVGFEAAVNIPNFITAWALLHEQTANTPKRVYVNGAAGGVGSAIIQLCKLAGIEVIAGASSAAKCDFASSCGADHVINYSSENVVERIVELTGGAGVDLFLDQLIGPDFTQNLKALAILGTIISFNAVKGLPEQDLFVEMRALLPRSPGVRCFSLHSYDKQPEVLARIMNEILPLFAAGKISAPIHEKLPLEQASKAHEWLDARKIMGKLVLVP